MVYPHRMRTTYYPFKMPSGEIENLSLREAFLRKDEPAIASRIQEIVGNLALRRRKKDGFEPGWQENIREYCSSRREYDRAIQRNGLVEVGYEYVPQEHNPDTNPCANREFVQACIDEGVDLSDNEKDAIMTGDYFKD